MKKKQNSANFLFKVGRDLELQKSYAEAVEQYKLALKSDLLHVEASNRLMIVYRRLKLYEKEAALITKLIVAHQKDIETKQRGWIKSHKKMAEMTKSLAHSLGLLSSKGLPLYENELLKKWEKRKAIVLTKIKKGK